MSRHYEPRQKKVIPPVRRMKIIRIDARTEIEVLASIPDDVARERFIAKRNMGPRAPFASLYPADEKPEVPQEELASVVDDEDLPETE